MLPPDIRIGDPRHRPDSNSMPDWFIRDMGERLFEPQPVRQWRLPIWPGFRLEFRILPTNGVEHV